MGVIDRSWVEWKRKVGWERRGPEKKERNVNKEGESEKEPGVVVRRI